MPLSTVIIGTYTQNPTHAPSFAVSPSEAEGLYSATFDSDTGELSEYRLAAEARISPSWLRAHPVLPVIYTTNETMDGEGDDCTPSYMSAYRVGPGGTLALLGRRVSTGGGSACHFSVHPSGKYLAVANHGLLIGDFSGAPSGGVAIIALNPTTGELQHRTDLAVHPNAPQNPADGTHPDRSDWTSHTHSCNWAMSGRWLFACEKGTDRVLVYAFDAIEGTISLVGGHNVTIGGGARHLAVHATGRFIYVNEESSPGRIWVFGFNDSTGELAELQVDDSIQTLAGTKGRVATSELALGPTGSVLYCSDRGTKTITTYAVGEDGRIQLLGHTPTGANPRHFKIDPEGKWMIVGALSEDRIDVFKLDHRGVPSADPPFSPNHQLDAKSPAHFLWLPAHAESKL